MSWIFTIFISALLLPPLSLILLGGISLGLLNRHRLLGKILCTTTLILLCALSMPVIADRLLAQFEHYPVINLAHPPAADAIVILGAGSYFDAPEYGGDTVSRYALERVRYGARLARATHLPVAVSGGNPAGGVAEAYLMRDTLQQDFNVATRWIEPHSNNTWANAHASRALLPSQINRIYLVTHAWHLPRAIYAFEHAGFTVIPAGTGYSLAKHINPIDFIPQPRGLTNSYFAIHEAIGLIWYRLKG
ncbi:YdcF family protein [Sulfuriferula nivalis]|nr:YdcF family protein [Sulfuriferula nivalis]